MLNAYTQSLNEDDLNEITSFVLDSFKNLTFESLTRSGISIGLGDLPNITVKKKVIIEGAVYDAIAETSWIEKGTRVKVVRRETTQIYVSKV